MQLDDNLIKNNDIIKISAFPKDEKFWRIDWFDEIIFPNRLIRKNQPSVLVHLSHVTSPAYPDDPSVLLHPNSTTAARSQRKVWISIGALTLLRIGDIWRNQELFERFPNILGICKTRIPTAS